ncbi:hypothetical protein H1R20_g10715, partial [Candolleomyces eurysporus]
MRLVLALAGMQEHHLCSVDISNPFTNGDLEEEIYMLQPEGFHEDGPNIKQAARQWNKKLHSVLTELGYQKLESDHSIYLYVKGELRMTVPVYISNITLACKDLVLIDRAVEELSNPFPSASTSSTCSSAMACRTCNPVTTPLVPGIKLSKSMGPQNSEEVKYMCSVPYLSAIGTLQYLCTMTWPDIAKAGTQDHKLTYTEGEDGLAFTTYCDASHGNCIDTGRSTGAYITCMAGRAIGWSSKLQTVVALSSTKAEYMAAVEAGKEILCMRNILS